MTGHSHDFSVSRGSRREHWPLVLPLLCGVYDSGDYMTFILLKMYFVQGIGVCGLYAYARYMRENTVYVSVSVTKTCHGAGNWQTADVCVCR